MNRDNFTRRIALGGLTSIYKMSAKKEDTTATAVSADAALEDDEFEEFPKEGTNAMRRACRAWCSISTTLLLSIKNSILSSAHLER